MKLQNNDKFLLLGIGGAGMRGLARLLHHAGKEVTGTDEQYDRLKNDPQLADFQLMPDTDADEIVGQVDCVIYSDAVPLENSSRRIARQAGIYEMPYHEALGQIAEPYTIIAVAGTHGKSSTTAMLAHILAEAGFDPTALVGASVGGWPHGHVRLGKSQYFVVEADEYRNHFLSLSPAHCVITSIDHDHPDFFATPADTFSSFKRFIRRVRPGGTVVISKETYDKTKTRLISWPPDVKVMDWPQPPLELVLPGEHMQQNAWLAITAAEALGVDTAAAKTALASFKGLGRRFENIGQYMSMNIISDYGHHPKEISVTLRAAEKLNSSLLVIFEPHTVQRYTAFYDEFLAVLQAGSAGVLVCPIYRARGETVKPPGSQRLHEDLKERGIESWFINDYEDLSSTLADLAPRFDQAIAFTAGELDEHLRDLVKH